MSLQFWLSISGMYYSCSFTTSTYFSKNSAFEGFLEQDGFGGPNSSLFWDIQTEANAAAQGILTTLNIVLDDIARIIPFALFPMPVGTQKPKEGFTQLKNRILKKYPQTLVVTSLQTLFSQLDTPTSWFTRCLERGIGMRQRLNHYTDLIILGASAPPGETKSKPQFQLASVGTPESTFDFPIELKAVLHGLCDWLDSLDAILTQHLSASAKAEDLNWEPSKDCPGYNLPIVGPSNDRHLPDVDYLYLPLCTPPV